MNLKSIVKTFKAERQWAPFYVETADGVCNGVVGDWLIEADDGLSFILSNELVVLLFELDEDVSLLDKENFEQAQTDANLWHEVMAEG